MRFPTRFLQILENKIIVIIVLKLKSEYKRYTPFNIVIFAGRKTNNNL